MKKNSITTTIEIKANVIDVWDMLADFASYPIWNPFIINVSGQPVTGKTLHITLARASGKQVRFKATVVLIEPVSLLKWRGRLFGIPGLFTGVHSFELFALPNGMTEVIHSERFSGLLSGIVFKSIRKEVEQNFISMNEAMAKRLTE